MPCKCCHSNVNSNCQTCEPNAANINLRRCAGYGRFNRCNCACPPSPRDTNDLNDFNEGCCCCCCGNDDFDCEFTNPNIQPRRLDPSQGFCPDRPFGPNRPFGPDIASFNPCTTLAKRAGNCVVDSIAMFIDEKIEIARTKFVEDCVQAVFNIQPRDGMGFGCEPIDGVLPPRPRPDGCVPVVTQTALAVSDAMTQDLFDAVDRIARRYRREIDNLTLPNPFNPNFGGCCCCCFCNGNDNNNNNNNNCGPCPTVGSSKNATTWGRCY